MPRTQGSDVAVGTLALHECQNQTARQAQRAFEFDLAVKAARTAAIPDLGDHLMSAAALRKSERVRGCIQAIPLGVLKDELPIHPHTHAIIGGQSHRGCTAAVRVRGQRIDRARVRRAEVMTRASERRCGQLQHTRRAFDQSQLAR